MQLVAKELVAAITSELKTTRQGLKRQPGIALIWVGEDEQTGAFIRSKQRLAKELDCAFWLHHFPEGVGPRQLTALIKGLNDRDGVDGIVLQLPLPDNLSTDSMIELIKSAKDIDGLTAKSPYPAPTATGIVRLLEANNINPADRRTIIIGAGRLVGSPLAKIWQVNSWPCHQLTSDAKSQLTLIKQHDLLIAATGVVGLVTAEMVHPNMVVVDGSGIDVDVEAIEPLVEAITPSKGAIGPLTVRYLFENLLKAATI